jgi:hypothetical protein
MFSNNIDENCETIKELLRGLPPSARGRAKKAAATIEKVFVGLQRNNPKDGATALGAAFAIYMIGARIVEQAKEGGKEHENLIQLLS